MRIYAGKYCEYRVRCFRTLSSYIAYLSITDLTLTVTLLILTLTLTPPLHKSAECTKLLFPSIASTATPLSRQ